MENSKPPEPKEQPHERQRNPPPDKFRPRIQKYQNGNKFHVGDSVYISGSGRGLQGPYLIASIPKSKKYTLGFESGAKVEEGRIFEEASLQFAT